MNAPADTAGPAPVAGTHAGGVLSHRKYRPPRPLWILILRALQFAVAVIVLGLCAWGVSQITRALPFKTLIGHDAFAFAFFAFAWTFLYLLWLLLAQLVVHAAYNIWAHLVLECLTVLFWLVAFALLARNASDYSTIDDATTRSDPLVNALLMSTYASAGLSALVWLLFIATLVHLSIHVHKFLRSKSAAKKGAAGGTAAAPAAGAPAASPYVPPVQQQQQQQQQQPQYPPQDAVVPPQGNHPHGYANDQPGYNSQPGYSSQPGYANGNPLAPGGVANTVSNPSMYGTYQHQGGPAQPVSPQATGSGYAPSPVPSPAPHHQHNHHNGGYTEPHAGAHEMSTFRGDPALAELGPSEPVR